MPEIVGHDSGISRPAGDATIVVIGRIADTGPFHTDDPYAELLSGVTADRRDLPPSAG